MDLLYLRGSLPTEPTLFSEMNVSVGGSDVADLGVSLRPGLKVSGRLEFNGSAEKPTADQVPSIAISLEPADGRTSGASSSARGRAEGNGQFTTVGVPAGRYLMRVTNAPKGWALRGAFFNGQDIADTAVELRGGDADGVVITFTDKPTDLSGTVTDESGAGDAKAAVLVFPTDRSAWTGSGTAPRRLKNLRTKTDGTYSTVNLPPGDYFVVAVSDAVAGNWDDPKFLEALTPAAARMHLDEGEKKTQTLRTAKVLSR